MAATSNLTSSQQPLSSCNDSQILQQVLGITRSFTKTVIHKSFITFPVGPNKVPKIKKWNELQLPQQIRTGIHYGIRTGQTSGITVLDFDVLKTDDPDRYLDGVEALRLLLNTHNSGKLIPQVPVISTQSAGVHLYFQYNRHLKSSIQAIPGDLFGDVHAGKKVKIDVLNDDRYVLGPGSPMYSHWDFISKPPVEMPTWLVEIVMKRSTAKRPSSCTPLTSRIRNARPTTIIEDSSSEEDNVPFANRPQAQVLANETVQPDNDDDEEWWSTVVLSDTISGQHTSIERAVEPHASSRIPRHKSPRLSHVIVNYVQLKNTVMKIRKQFADSYDSWSKVLWAIAETGRNSGYDAFPIADEWSKQSQKYVDSKNVRNKYQQSNGSLGYTYLHRLAYPLERGGESNNASRPAPSPAKPAPSPARPLPLTTATMETEDNVAVQTGNQRAVRSQMELTEAVLSNHEEIRRSHTYFKTLRGSALTQGLYVCNEDSCIWELRDVSYLRQLVHPLLVRVAVNDAEKKHVGQLSNLNSICTLLTDKLLDGELDKKMDSHLDYFVFNNGIWDTVNQTFRPIVPEDWVSHTSGYSYDKRQSEQHKGELDEFLKKIFPDEEVRQHFLRYVASLLQGIRIDRHFLVLTDRRSGSNGKSTSLKLVECTFGNYYLSKPETFVEDKTPRGKHGHSAGEMVLNNRRVIVGDEFTNRSILDTALMRRMTGGESISRGRIMYKDVTFHFIFQAGLILCFNEGDCPKFNHRDSAFLDRMVTIPMISKFAPSFLQDDPVNFNFRAEPEVNTTAYLTRFRSSFFDLLKTHFNRAGLTDQRVPQLVKEAKQVLTIGNQPVSSWLEENLVPQAEPEEYVTLHECYEQFRLDNGSLTQTTFYRLAREYCETKSIDVPRNFT